MLIAKFSHGQFRRYERTQIINVTYRISGDHSASTRVIYIRHTDIGIDVQDNFATTGAEGSEAKYAAIVVVI